MSKVIKYETTGWRCETICPNGMRSNVAGIMVATLVGSFGCVDCPHFVSSDLDKQEITCSYPGEENQPDGE